ncbi:hypothetical protein ACK8OR_02985 [Jannaschia sp. KMU-145]|uniref:hypothetical protein n=1 Tax=Jannaschia halovivens TaxID=3388667 RepID=UPI00396B2AD9
MAKKTYSLNEWHQGALTAVGVSYAFAAAITFYSAAQALGLLADPAAHLTTLLAMAATLPLPLLLAVPRLLPKAISEPSRWYHVPLVIIALLVLSAIGAYPLYLRALAAGIPTEVINRYDSAFLTVTGLVSVIAAIVTSIRLVRRGPLGGSGVQSIPVDDLAPALRQAPVRSTKLESTHLFFLRLTGLPMFGSVAYGAATEPNPMIWGIVAAALGLVAAVMHLSPRWTPRVLARPSRWYHFFGWNLLESLLFCFALLPFVAGAYGPIIAQAAEDAAAGIERSQAEIGELVVTSLMASPGVLAYFAISIPVTLAWFTMIGLLFQKPSARPVAATTTRTSDMPAVAKELPPIPKRVAKRAQLPAIGAAMKLYLVADWLVLRLVGLGLLGTAYMLWLMIEAERTSRAAQLSYGQDPMHALYAYAGLGTLLALPFLMPGFLSRPNHVAGGLAKAVLLVVSAFLLLPALHLAIDLFTPDIYHATLHLTVPNVFKAVAGIAVTSALLISFFRQLGGLPKMDGMGNPKIEMSPAEMRDMRIARMAHQSHQLS